MCDCRGGGVSEPTEMDASSSRRTEVPSASEWRTAPHKMRGGVASLSPLRWMDVGPSRRGARRCSMSCPPSKSGSSRARCSPSSAPRTDDGDAPRANRRLRVRTTGTRRERVDGYAYVRRGRAASDVPVIRGVARRCVNEGRPHAPRHSRQVRGRAASARRVGGVGGGHAERLRPAAQGSDEDL